MCCTTVLQSVVVHSNMKKKKKKHTKLKWSWFAVSAVCYTFDIRWNMKHRNWFYAFQCDIFFISFEKNSIFYFLQHVQNSYIEFSTLIYNLYYVMSTRNKTKIKINSYFSIYNFLPLILLNCDLAILSKNNSPADRSTVSGGT